MTMAIALKSGKHTSARVASRLRPASAWDGAERFVGDWGTIYMDGERLGLADAEDGVGTFSSRRRSR